MARGAVAGAVQLEDLPPKLRSQITAAAPRSRSKRGSRGAGGRGNFRCHQCGHKESALAAAQRHADEQRHFRIEVVLEHSP